MARLPADLVDVQWLESQLHEPDLVVLDASVPPVVPGFVSVNAGTGLRVIPGARRFDYDQQICKPDSDLPHMMPSPEQFQQQMQELGIDGDSRLVVYDDVGIYASPRAWWMLKAMGHDQVAVLDGGLPAWLAADQPLQGSHAIAERAGDFLAEPQVEAFCGADTVLAALDDARCQIIDARSAGRFHGQDPEPRPNMRGGHMPSARNLPFAAVLDGGLMRPVEQLQALFAPLASADQRIITSCGSGLTACVLTFAAHLAGYRQLSVYDGSWSEWGRPSKLPVVSD